MLPPAQLASVTMNIVSLVLTANAPVALSAFVGISNSEQVTHVGTKLPTDNDNLLGMERFKRKSS